MTRSTWNAFLALPWLVSASAIAQTDRAGVDFFEKKIRPVLAASCLSCHSDAEKKRKGGLALDTREGVLRGGNTGPAVVSGKPNESLLIKAIRYADKDTAMPPKTAGGKLPDAVIRDFETWVRMGAPDPRGGAGIARPVKKAYDPEAAKNHWAYKPVVRPAIPNAGGAGFDDIDRLVVAGLAEHGLTLSPQVDSATLLRRVYFDLVGLPPSPTEVDVFVTEAARDLPKALEAVVDRLLASPEFGRRWGRHWLDVARYAESTGKDVNIAFPHAWRYRDYVVDAFNADKPYDRFIREQIAGDLLPAANDRQKAEQNVATAFLAMGAMSLNEMNQRQFAVDLADEQIDTVSQAFLGSTIACARCHDHKFDPFSQKDYAALAGIFLSTQTKYGTTGGVGSRNSGPIAELPAAAGLPIVAKGLTPTELKTKKERFETLNAELKEAFGGAAGKDRKQAKEKAKDNGLNVLRLITQIGQLRVELGSVNEDGSPKTLSMGVADKPKGSGGGGFAGRGPFGKRPGLGGGGLGGFRRGGGFDSIADAPLFARGEITKPEGTVPRGVPSALSKGMTAPAIGKDSSGRRELADWIASPKNPLTARVMANRVWHWLMGRGIVGSVDNFGTTGDTPANQALLDHLASRFVAEGWSVKKLVRAVVLSRTYRQAASHDAEALSVDPENALFGRAIPRRLDAECIRDGMLAAAGLLDLSHKPGSVIARGGDGPIGGPRFFGTSEDAVHKADGNFRSLYLPIARNILPDVLEVFDFPDPSMVNGAREATNVPSQALFLLNGEFTHRTSHATAERITRTYPAPDKRGGPEAAFDERIELAYRLVLSRTPRAEEKTAAKEFLHKFGPGPGSTNPYLRSDNTMNAWTSLCRALFSSAEYRHLR